MSIMTMMTLAVYILGIWAAFFQLQHWSGRQIADNDEYQVLFMLSTLSWLVYPAYGVAWIINKIKEG